MIARYGTNIDFSASGNLTLGNNLYNEFVKYIDENQYLADDLI